MIERIEQCWIGDTIEYQGNVWEVDGTQSDGRWVIDRKVNGKIERKYLLRSTKVNVVQSFRHLGE